MGKFEDNLNRRVKGMELYYAVFVLIFAGVTLYADATGQGLLLIFSSAAFLLFNHFLFRALQIKRGDYGRVQNPYKR